MQVKGTALRSVVVALERIGGKDALAKVRAVLPADVLALLDTLVPSSWYPITASAELHAAIRKTLGQGSTVMNYRVGVEAAKVDFSGVYRAILWTVDAESALGRTERTWRLYNSEGSARWERLARGDALCRIEGVTDYNQAMWFAIAGRFEGLVRLCGASSARAEVVRSDATSCSIHIVWTP